MPRLNPVNSKALLDAWNNPGPDDDIDTLLRRERRKARREWRAAADLKRLAKRLGVRQVLAETSRDGTQGEYLDGSKYLDGIQGGRRRQIANREPAILIDLEHAPQEGVRNVLAHEIGHHIDTLADGPSPKQRKPSIRFVSAFEGAGLRIRLDNYADHFSELIAETFGQYLCGHKLNAGLLFEVRRVLAKLTPKHATVVEKFRRTTATWAACGIVPPRGG